MRPLLEKVGLLACGTRLAPQMAAAKRGVHLAQYLVKRLWCQWRGHEPRDVPFRVCREATCSPLSKVIYCKRCGRFWFELEKEVLISRPSVGILYGEAGITVGEVRLIEDSH